MFSRRILLVRLPSKKGGSMDLSATSLTSLSDILRILRSSLSLILRPIQLLISFGVIDCRDGLLSPPFRGSTLPYCSLGSSSPFISSGCILYMWSVLRRFPAYIYDLFISTFFTIAAHLFLIDRMSLPGGNFLDVGCGTGAPLKAILNKLKGKQQKIVGVDLHPTYTQQAVSLFSKEPQVEIYNMNFYEIQQHLNLNFRMVFFSFSLMLMPDHLKALETAKAVLSPSDDSRIGIVMTLNQNRNSWMARLKPLIRRFTSVDFGQVVYADDLLSVIDQAELEVTKNIRIRNNWNPFLWLSPVYYIECKRKQQQ